MSYTTRTIVHLIAFIAVLTMNYLSNALPLNGKTPGELSDQYPNLFVPAGLTFAIWGVIYLWLFVWMVALAIGLWSASVRQRLEPVLVRTGWLFPLTCLFNIGWLFAWHWLFVALSVVVMMALLWTLVRLNLAAGVGQGKANGLEKWLAHPAYGLYQGWITVALIANVTALLVSNGFTGGDSADIWAVVMIVAGGAIAIWVTLRTNNIFHGFAVVWALYGIYLKRSTLADAPVVAWAALAMMAAVLAVALLRLPRWLR